MRCFHCGIGLQNWDSEDNPFVEHARWSQECQFLKDKKGLDFIATVQDAVRRVQLVINFKYCHLNFPCLSCYQLTWPKGPSELFSSLGISDIRCRDIRCRDIRCRHLNIKGSLWNYCFSTRPQPLLGHLDLRNGWPCLPTKMANMG